MRVECDFLVIGSGIAGLSFALQAASRYSVAVVTKRDIFESATKFAQGGIASVFSAEDSFDAHVEDTLTAGAGICHEDVVRMVVEDGPRTIRSLIEWGVNFTASGGEYDLTREGGHSARRILHAEDITGREIERALVEAVRRHPNVRVFEKHIAIDLITATKLERSQLGKNRCLGAYVLDITSGDVATFSARITLLATGGAGKVYLYTSNPDVASGDGVAMAYRASATIANMEFMQFHPTTLFHPLAKSFLISEAVRGEGAILRRRDGTAFMEKYHGLKELAPRDIVARAIDNEMKKSGDDCVFLDITHEPPDVVRSRFPNIYRTCLEFGLDMTKEWLPVVPAAHYLCGGVAARPTSPGSMPSARCPLPGCTAPTAWPATPCLRLRSTPAAPTAMRRRSSHRSGKSGAPSLNGTRGPQPTATRWWSSPRTGMRSAAPCGIMSASSARTSAWSGPCGASG
jgi:L-aspartate oxidase